MGDKLRKTSANSQALLFYCQTPRKREELTEFMKIGIFAYIMKRYLQPLLE